MIPAECATRLTQIAAAGLQYVVVPLAAYGPPLDGYLQALDVAKQTIQAFAPGALVVALGLDASEHDPLAGLAVTTNGFRRIGAAIATCSRS